MRLEALHKKNLVKAKKIMVDSVTDQLVPQVSSLKTPKMFWFLDQAIWRKEHTLEDDLKKPVEECQDQECRDHAVIRVSQIKEQLEAVKEEVKNAEVVMATLNGLLGSWNSFIQGMCDYFQQTLGRRRSSSLKIKLSSSKEDPSSMRNMNISTLEELLIHLIIWIRNDAIMNE